MLSTLRGARHDLHKLNPIAIRITRPALPVRIFALSRFGVQLDAMTFQMIRNRMNICYFQTQVVVPDRSLWMCDFIFSTVEQLYELTLAHLDVDDPRGSIISGQLERFLQSKDLTVKM
jgi:hypothetical protein